MIFAERDRVIFRENGVGPPKHGVVIGIGHAIEEIYFVEIPHTNGMSDCITASGGELSKKEETKKRYIVAREAELEKEK